MGTTGAFEYYDNRLLGQQPTVGNTGVSNSFGNRNLREERADTYTLGMVMDVHENVTLTVDWYEIEIQDMIALEGPDAIYQRCLSLAFNPAGDPNTQACQLVNRDPANGAPSNVDRTFTNQGRAVMSGVDVQIDWMRDLWGGQFGLNSVANFGLKSITQDRPDLAEVENAGVNSCSLQIQCQRYDYRVFSTLSFFKGAWNASLRHQYWPELEHNTCALAPTSDACLYSSYPDQHLFSATFGYTFAEKYRLSLGIENLFDKDPPCVGAEPNRVPYAFTCEHASQVAGDQFDSTFDVLGRRYFVSMTMDF